MHGVNMLASCRNATSHIGATNSLSRSGFGSPAMGKAPACQEHGVFLLVYVEADEQADEAITLATQSKG